MHKVSIYGILCMSRFVGNVQNMKSVQNYVCFIFCTFLMVVYLYLNAPMYKVLKYGILCMCRFALLYSYAKMSFTNILRMSRQKV